MEYSIRNENGQCRVIFAGYLTYQDHDTLRIMLQKLKEQNAQSVILDMEELEYIDSSGLGMYLLIREQVESSGGTLTIGPINHRVEKAFRMFRFI